MLSKLALSMIVIVGAASLALGQSGFDRVGRLRYEELADSRWQPGIGPPPRRGVRHARRSRWQLPALRLDDP